MKILHLLRHAKSSWDDPRLSDCQRVLNGRGERDARRMGTALARQLAPMSITVSPARRAQLTLEGLCDAWPALATMTHCTDADLYTFECDQLLRWIECQDDGGEALFIIGHNPALTDLSNHLSAAPTLDNLPTAGYVQLVCPVASWSQVQSRPARMALRLFPRDLR